MDQDLAEELRAKVREALAKHPFRDLPHFEDVIEAAVAAASHVASGATGTVPDGVADRLASLEGQCDRIEAGAFRRVTAAVATADAAAAAVRDLAARVAALEAIGASQRQAEAQKVLEVPAAAVPPAGTDTEAAKE